MASTNGASLPPSLPIAGAMPPPHKCAFERYEDTISEIGQLDIQLAMLEGCSHTKLGEFARPFAIRLKPHHAPPPSSPVPSHLLLSPAHVSMRNLYDDDGVNLYERFLRAHMRLVPLTKLVFGPLSVEYIGAELALAVSYMRAGLWKQCHDHACTAEAIVKEQLDPVDAVPSVRSQDAKRAALFQTISTRRADAQLHHAFTIFARLDANGDGRIARAELLAAIASNEYFDQLNTTKASAMPNAFAALCDPQLFEQTFDEIDTDASGALQWDEVVRYLHANDRAFQTYCQQLERTIPPDLLTALHAAFHEPRMPGDSLAQCLQASDLPSIQRIGDYMHALHMPHAPSWPEMVEMACRAASDEVHAGLTCKIALLHGRYFMKRGQLDDALQWLRRAVSDHQAVVGHEHHAMADYYVALADALCLRHTQAQQQAKETAEARFDKWLASVDGLAAVRDEARRILDECYDDHGSLTRPKNKRPTKKEADATARRHLREAQAKADEHQQAATSSSSPFLDEATELYVKVWTLHDAHYGREDTHTAIAYAGLGNVYILRNEPGDAVVYFTKAIETFEAACGGASVPASAFLAMHVAKIHAHHHRPVDAMALLQHAARFFRDHAGKFHDSETTRRDAAANAIDAWRGWLQLADIAPNPPPHEAVWAVHRDLVQAAEIGYGEFSLEAGDARSGEGHFLSQLGHEHHKDAEAALDAACYILEIHHGPNDKRVRKLRQEIVSLGAKRKQAETSSPRGTDHAWLT
ncbi:Aste57867_20966 [Aphanomyces stellatus]|uniref:Aste57867_20966 protein n=1 Tax=Aphanomyces stellatus TaxID=120398 RepID=A0A485LL18_9STRA|nr:hypothetical protein As57867_020898 [Aphanomyces stellatus]VFT97642.1 Aste57867_20966 [Aphanomyces stellatus]